MQLEEQIELVTRRIYEEARSPLTTMRVLTHCMANLNDDNTVRSDRTQMAERLGLHLSSVSTALGTLQDMRVVFRQRIAGKMLYRLNHNVATHLPGLDEETGKNQRADAQARDKRITERPPLQQPRRVQGRRTPANDATQAAA